MRQPRNEPERTCILTREPGGRNELIRLALSPDGDVLPDLGAKAPGRGAWLGVDAAALDAAQAKGALKGALARAFKGEAKSVPDDLSARIGDGLRARALDRLGLEMKAGHLVFGFERVLSAVQSGASDLVLHAADAGDDGCEKLDRAVRQMNRHDDPDALQNEGGRAKSLVLPVDRAALSM
ncbi:MAG: DUF448 domain-containing protein, partial [Pacificimonas sp.]